VTHHKRGRPKSSRAGCLMCKEHKANGSKKMTAHQTMQERKARQAERADRLLEGKGQGAEHLPPTGVDG